MAWQAEHLQRHGRGGSPKMRRSWCLNAVYYGMLFFRQAAQGRLVPTECTTTANLVSYAAVDADGTLRVVLVNKDLTRRSWHRWPSAPRRRGRRLPA